MANMIAARLAERRMVPTQIGGEPAVTLLAGRFPVRTIARGDDGRFVQFDWRPWIRIAVNAAWRNGSYHREFIVTTARSITVITPDGWLWHACLRRMPDGELHLDVVDYQAEGRRP